MINFSTIGRNFIVDSFLEAADSFDNLSLRGVYSRTQASASEFAKKHNAETTYTSIDELCKDNKTDFVYIASPNACHASQAIQLLNAGKHVLLEKPAVLSEKELLDVFKASKESGSIFMEAAVPLHMPAFSQLQSLLPTIGEIRCADLSFCQYSSRYDRFKSGIMTNTFDPTLGNGALMDLGIYCIEILAALFGIPDTLSGSSVFLPESIDAVSSFVCNYGGKIAKITASKVSDSPIPSQIQGENGCITIDKISRPKIITLYKKNEEPIIYDMSSSYPDMAYEIKSFISQLNGDTTDFYNKVTHTSIKICDMARKELGIDFKKRK